MKKLIVIAITLVVLFACSKSTTNLSGGAGGNTTVDCSGAAKSFSKDVSPVIQSTCATGSSCHAAGSENGPGELVTYPEISAASSQIRSAVLSGVMPKSGVLSASEKNSIICWIDNGSMNN